MSATTYTAAAPPPGTPPAVNKTGRACMLTPPEGKGKTPGRIASPPAGGRVHKISKPFRHNIAANPNRDKSPKLEFFFTLTKPLPAGRADCCAGGNTPLGGAKG